MIVDPRIVDTNRMRVCKLSLIYLLWILSIIHWVLYFITEYCFYGFDAYYAYKLILWTDVLI